MIFDGSTLLIAEHCIFTHVMEPLIIHQMLVLVIISLGNIGINL